MHAGKGAIEEGTPGRSPAGVGGGGIPVAVEDLKAIDIEDADDGVLAVKPGVVVLHLDDGVDAAHDPAEQPLVDGLGGQRWRRCSLGCPSQPDPAGSAGTAPFSRPGRIRGGRGWAWSLLPHGGGSGCESTTLCRGPRGAAGAGTAGEFPRCSSGSQARCNQGSQALQPRSLSKPCGLCHEPSSLCRLHPPHAEDVPG